MQFNERQDKNVCAFCGRITCLHTMFERLEICNNKSENYNVSIKDPEGNIQFCSAHPSYQLNFPPHSKFYIRNLYVKWIPSTRCKTFRLDSCCINRVRALSCELKFATPAGFQRRVLLQTEAHAVYLKLDLFLSCKTSTISIWIYR